MTAEHIPEARIEDIHRLYRTRQLTPAELVAYYLRRIEALDLSTEAGPPFNCIVCVSPHVREEAQALTDDIARRGVTKPLHGVPVWAKDNIPVEGLPTTCGCLALEPGVAAADAPLIRNLRSAGAIIMGKVGMTELSLGVSPYSSMSGRIGNAFDARNPPGGSSNGSAVAVSLNFGMLAVGVDDCGSITYPAAVNSCVGLRPTIGLVSPTGLFSYSHTETTPGPIARSVADAARMLDALAVPASEAAYSDVRDLGSIRGIRIGVLAAIDPIEVMSEVPGSIRQAFADRLADIKAAGAIVIDPLRLDGVRWARKSGLEHYNAQVASLRARTKDPRTPRQLYSSNSASPVVRRFRRHPLFGFGPPFGLPNIHAAAYRRVIRHNRTVFARLLASAAVDAVIAVTTSAPSRIATLAQIPHLTIPAGCVPADQELAASGFVEGSTVPWGLSILAGPGRDRELLAIGLALEQTLGGRVVPRPPGAGHEAASGELDIEQFNRFKKDLAHRSSRSLQLDADGREYVHPTADEFRALVREVTSATRNRLAVRSGTGA